MPKLLHKDRQQVIANSVLRAEGFRQRVRGLIGRPALKEGEAFWITACPSIHTFFMKFPIDVLFTDRKFQVLSLFENVSSGKLLFGRLGSRNVFEIKAGQIKTHQLKQGDNLYVEP